MQQKDIETFCPKSQDDWRSWLQENHHTKQSIWLIYYKKNSGNPSVSYSDAVDEALCFGWIDSVKKSIDDQTFIQFFSRRKPNSGWSKVNKEKIKRLTDSGMMTQAGIDCIEAARQNGSWTMLDEVEELKIPDDLHQEFELHAGSLDFFMSLSRSAKKAILQWLVFAKLAQTRQKRMTEIAVLAAQKLKPKQFR